MSRRLRRARRRASTGTRSTPPVAHDDALARRVRRPRAVRARRRVRRRSDPAAAMPRRSWARPTTSSASDGADGCSSPSAASCSRPTSSPAPAGSSTSPRSSWATTATRALEHAAGIGPTTDARPRGPRAERGITPQRAAEDLARARIAEEGRGRRWQPGDPAAWTNGDRSPHAALRASPRQLRGWRWLAHVAGVAEGVAAGLGPDGEAVRLGADRDLGDLAARWC